MTKLYKVISKQEIFNSKWVLEEELQDNYIILGTIEINNDLSKEIKRGLIEELQKGDEYLKNKSSFEFAYGIPYEAEIK